MQWAHRQLETVEGWRQQRDPLHHRLASHFSNCPPTRQAAEHLSTSSALSPVGGCPGTLTNLPLLQVNMALRILRSSRQGELSVELLGYRVSHNLPTQPQLALEVDERLALE